MPRWVQDKLEGMLVDLCETAAGEGVPKDEFKKWIESEIEVQLDQYDEGV